MEYYQIDNPPDTYQKHTFYQFTTTNFLKVAFPVAMRIQTIMVNLNSSDVTEGAATVQQFMVDTRSGEIAVRLYSDPTCKSTPQPCVIYFHGGGWMGGALDDVENFCMALCYYCRCKVISVDYTLSTEGKFPRQLEEGADILDYCRRNEQTLHIDADRLYLGGDSAGGNIAAGLAMMMRDNNTNVAGQILIYPVVNVANLDSDSFQIDADGFIGMRKLVEAAREVYLSSEEEYLHPYVSPLLSDDLSRLPKALTIVAELDGLRDDAVAYAKALSEQGNQSICVMVKESPHGFISHIGKMPQAMQIMPYLQRFIE